MFGAHRKIHFVHSLAPVTYRRNIGLSRMLVIIIYQGCDSFHDLTYASWIKGGVSYM